MLDLILHIFNRTLIIFLRRYCRLKLLIQCLQSHVFEVAYLSLYQLEAHDNFLLEIVSMKIQSSLHLTDVRNISVNGFLCWLESLLDPRVKFIPAFIASLLEREYCVPFMAVRYYTIDAENTTAFITKRLDHSIVRSMS